MSKLTGGALLLVLGVPLALYAALALKAVARADLVGGDPPADRGASKDDLAKLRAKAGNWLGEVRKATTVAGQYRAATAEDNSPDRAVDAAVKAASARAKNLLDVDRFLSNTVNPKFEGKLDAVFGKWHAGRADLGKAESAVVRLLDAPQPVTSAAAATAAMKDVRDLIAQYTDSQFADRAKAAEWRVKARLHVVTGLERTAEEQYEKTVRAKLPLEESASATAKATLAALGEHAAGLQADAEQARAEGAALAPAVLGTVGEKKPLIELSAARKTMLDLLAEDKLFEKAGGAAAWLGRVGAAYRKSDPRTRALIRNKVQEFCEAFAAPVAQLDDRVMLEGKPVPRASVRVVYAPRAGADDVFAKLELDADGLNEHTLPTKPPGANPYLVHDTGNMSRSLAVDKLKPTDLSAAAVAYNAARRAVVEAAGRAKWTPNSLAELKKACEAKKELVDQLKVPGGAVPQLWVRLTGLADGAAANPDLFGDQ